MFFKKACQSAELAAVCLLLGVLGAASSCSRERLPLSSSVGLAGSDTGCLDQAARTTARYLEGQATEAEAAEIWNCAIHSLQLFSDRARGETAGIYTPGELRAFLEKYFLTEHKIPDSLLREGMELKRAFFGGQADRLTLEELAQTRALLVTFREQSLRLLPYMPLSIESMDVRGEAKAEAAGAALLQAAQAVGTSLEATGNSYTFAHLAALLQEVKALASKEMGTRISLFQGQLGTIQALKAVFFASPGERIAGDEWLAALTLSARAWGVIMRLQSYRSHDDSWMIAPGRDHGVTLAREVLELIEESVRRHPQSQITFEELDGLLDTVIPKGFEPLPGRLVKVEHFKAFLRPLVQRLMGGLELGRNGRAAIGLTVPLLENAWKTVLHWSEGQRYLETLFAAAQHRARPGPRAEVNSMMGFEPSALVDSSLTVGDAAVQLQKIIQRDRPMFLGKDERITFAGFHFENRHSFHNLTQLNWMYELARVLARGYAEAASRGSAPDDTQRKINFSEFKSFCTDIHDLGVDTRYLDPWDEKLAEKRFREAELFTYAGDGGEFLTVQQAAQLLAMLYAGKQEANQIHDEIAQGSCGKKLGPLDPFGYVTIDAQCYRDAFFGEHPPFWAFTPKLQAYYERLNEVQREDFRQAMEIGARKAGYTNSMMNSSDSEGFAMLSQYIEVIFARFDLNDSGTLDEQDAELAFPVFSGELEKMSCLRGHCLHDPLDLKAVFTYMLSYGEAPTTAQFVKWRYFKWLPFSRHGTAADRGRILHIFSALAAGS